MEKLLELRRQRAAFVAEIKAILEKAETEGRDLTPEEQQSYDVKMADIARTKAAEDRHIQVSGLEDELRTYGDLNAPGAPGVPAQRVDPGAEKRWGSFGEQLRAVAIAGMEGGRVDPRLIVEREDRAISGMSELVPADGGFLVQTDFATELIKRTWETGILPARCRKLPISSGANGIKINAINETSRVDGSRWGGIRAYWACEAEEKTASAPKFRQIELSLNKLIGLCYATDELLQDAAALESVIMQGFPEEFGFKVDDALINGNGAGQPLGVLASACLVTVAKETGQAAATIVARNIQKMWPRLWAKSRPSSAWFINQDIEDELANMNLPVGTGGVSVYLPAGGLSDSPYSKLYGRPVIPIEQCATLGTLGDIILGDFSQYLIADKGGIQSASSIHVRFIYDESVFRFVYRVDGQPSWNSALTPYKGTNTLSPFVVLATRA